MIARATTNSVLREYRYNLQRSTHTKNKAMETVLTGRLFNSFAEDPAAAVQSFQLRRSLLRTESQSEVGDSVIRKYEMAWDSLLSVVDDVDNQAGDSAFTAILRGENAATAGGRTALGKELTQLAENIVHTMNSRYGDNYIFAGTDGLEVPFTWSERDPNTGVRQLFYRGVDVSSAAGTDGKAKLDYMVNDETKYADLGLGLEEDDNGDVIPSSAVNVALQGVYYLGYGVDETDNYNDPNNIAVMIDRMGAILQRCDAESGEFASKAEEEEFYRLGEKFQLAASALSDRHVELDTQAKFIKGNQELLENKTYTLQEQIVGIEDVEMADAITAYSWAQYSYNAALKVGNSVLSESLMDYLST